MGFFDWFKKKKSEEKKIDYVSFSEVTEDGEVMECYGYWEPIDPELLEQDDRS